MFAGLDSVRARLERLVDEIDAFYRRGQHRLAIAHRERVHLPPVEAFLQVVEGGIAALAAEALGQEATPRRVGVAAALLGLGLWQALEAIDMPAVERRELRLRLVEEGIATIR